VQTLRENNKSETNPVIDITVNREDAQRGRLHVTTPLGEDLKIDLPRGKAIKNGEVFGPSEKGNYYRTVVKPEPVIEVTLEKTDSPVENLENAIKLGYSLGNRHLEVIVEGEAVYVPLILDEEKIRGILKRTNLPIRAETKQKVISQEAKGYYAGEDED
jgi:urease accessory protein UreE